MLSNELLKNKPSVLPGESAEIRCQINRSRSVGMLSGNLTANSRSEAKGMSARVYKNGVYGFSCAPVTDSAVIPEIMDEALKNARFMDSHIAKNKRPLKALGTGEYIQPFSEADAAQKTYIDFVRALDAYVSGKYKKLQSRSLSVRCDSSEKVISTTDGYTAHIFMPRSFIYASFTAEGENGAPVELFTPIGGRGLFEERFSAPEALYGELDRLYEKLMQKKCGVRASSGIRTCVLDGTLAGMLAHEAVGHTVEADLVLAGSVAAHCMNKTVASPKVSIVDFAHTAPDGTAPLPVYVDDEGTPAEDAVLIKDGVLTGYMNNRESAQHFGVEPKGNARAYGFADEPLIRMRNTAILPGADKIEDMIASVEDGYYLVDTNNGQADTTGEFMFGIAMGYEIKNGKLGQAILDTTISGVAFDMLKTVDMVSDTMSWNCSGYCGKKQPMPVGLGGAAVRCRIMVG